MKNELVGWDDGSIYFYDENGVEFCINENADLLHQMIAMGAEYFRAKKANTTDEGVNHEG